MKENVISFTFLLLTLEKDTPSSFVSYRNELKIKKDKVQLMPAETLSFIFLPLSTLLPFDFKETYQPYCIDHYINK